MSVTFIDSYRFVSGIVYSMKTSLPSSPSNITRGGVYADLSNAKWFVTLGLDSSSNGTTTYFYSTDGDTWSSGTLPSATENRAIATDGSRVVICSTTAVGNSQAYVSTNGTTWTSYSLPSTGLTPVEMIWDGTRFLAVTSDTGANGIIYSTDGTSWTGVDPGNGGVTIDFDGTSRYILINTSAGNLGRTCTSNPTVAGNWTSITLPATAAWAAVRYGAGIWVAVRSNSSGYATSTNGTTWTSRTLPFTPNTGIPIELVFWKDLFHMYQDGTLYTSSNGTSWTTHGTTWTSSTLDAVYWWIKGPDRLLGVGNETTTLRSTDYLSGA